MQVGFGTILNFTIHGLLNPCYIPYYMQYIVMEFFSLFTVNAVNAKPDVSVHTRDSTPGPVFSTPGFGFFLRQPRGSGSGFT
jgi:hypothetical protein